MASRTKIVSAFLLIALAAYGAAPAEGLGSSRNVKALTDRQYTAAASDGKVHIVKYYAPWCGHCKSLAPAWDQLGDFFAKDLAVEINKVDCTSEKQACSSADVKGYPTLKAVYKGKIIDTHQGPRDLPSLKKFAQGAAKKAGVA